MLEIPGYRWDEASKRYFKDDRRTPTAAAQTSTAGKNRKTKLKHSKVDETKPKAAQRQQNLRRSHLSRSSKSSLLRILDGTAAQPYSLGTYGLLRQHSLAATFNNLKPSRIEQPNLSQGDTITCLDFDKQDPEIVRYGTSAGLLGKGRLARDARLHGPSVDAWEVEHILGAPISSLRTHQGYMVATSLGPIAQAVFGRTDSHAHVKFAPRQTSLWSSTIWGTQIALGCDKKVLYARNPADQAFQSFGTGSAVFALDLQQDDLFVATRSGHVRLFDVRQHGKKSGQVQPPQILLRLPSPVTNIRVMTDKTFIVAQMDGGLARYDTRYVKERAEPVTVYQGHVNTQSRTLGFDLCNEHVLSAAGEDGVIRSWLVSSGTAFASLPTRTLIGDLGSDNVPLRYQQSPPSSISLWVSGDRSFTQFVSSL